MIDKRHLSITVPPVPDFAGPARVGRWFYIAGATVRAGQPLVTLTDGYESEVVLPSPADGVLVELKIYAEQDAKVGQVLAILQIADDFVLSEELDWENFDRVTDILSDFSTRTRDAKSQKDNNDALAELLGIGENIVFRKLNVEQQNQFLQNIARQYQETGISPASMAQKLLQGLQLRPATPSGPRGPAPTLGMRPAAPGMRGPGGSGGGGGMRTQPPQQLPPQNDDDYS